MQSLMKSLFSTFAASLLLVAGFAAAPATAQDMGQPAEGPTVVDVAVEADDFNLLVEALQATGLDAALQGDGPFTVLAPTDEAFEALGEELERLLQKENIQELVDILSYHVVPAEAYAESVVEMEEAPTVLGTPIGIMVDNGTVTLSGANSAQVIQTDIEASNGVIHVIDTVLLPPEDDNDEMNGGGY